MITRWYGHTDTVELFDSSNHSARDVFITSIVEVKYKGAQRFLVLCRFGPKESRPICKHMFAYLYLL